MSFACTWFAFDAVATPPAVSPQRSSGNSIDADANEHGDEIVVPSIGMISLLVFHQNEIAACAPMQLRKKHKHPENILFSNKHMT
jgi:hypothetical protein